MKREIVTDVELKKAWRITIGTLILAYIILSARYWVTGLWILLGLAVALCVYCYVMLVRESDETKIHRRREAKKSLQTTDSWGPLLAARNRYNRDIEQWMTPEELRQRRGF